METRLLQRVVARARAEQGFTLTETLVVALIIGILAATALPSMLGQRDRAYASEAKSAARSAFQAAEVFYIERQTYSGITRADLIAIEPSLGDAPWSPSWCGGGNNGLLGDGETLCIAMRARGSSIVEYEMRRDASYGPGIVRLCSNPGKGGCRPGGVFGWGAW